MRGPRVVLAFPAHRVRRPRSSQVFAAYAELEAQSRALSRQVIATSATLVALLTLALLLQL